MNFWDFLDRRFNQLPGWPSGRGLVGLSMVAMSVMILWMVREYPELRGDDFFKTIAGAIIITGLINSVVAYHYSQNETSEHFSNEAAKRQSDRPSGRANDPVHVEEEQ